MANYACRRQFGAIKTNEPSALKPAHELRDSLPGVIQMEKSLPELIITRCFCERLSFWGKSSLEAHTCASGGRIGNRND